MIDHITLAGPNLDLLQAAFRAVGLHSLYGGTHSNGLTHMALVPCVDGSYVELVSLVDASAETAPWWDAPIRGGGGLCAWAVRSSGIERDVEELRRRGVAVDGPRRMHRLRDDGQRVEWELAVAGSGPIGSMLPFLIEDRTPRELRVPTAPLSSSPSNPIGGVARVVLGVHEVAAASRALALAWDAPPPRALGLAWEDVEVYELPGTPVALAAPLQRGSWLASRLARFGDLPCACILRAIDPRLEESLSLLSAIAREERWPEGRVLWWEPSGLAGSRIGFLFDSGGG